MDEMIMFNGTEMTSKARILVLSASTYNMLNERQESLSGCTVRYLFFGEEGEGVYTRTERDPRKPVGLDVAKCSIDIGLREKLVKAPAVYDGEFVMRVGSDGKPVMRLRDIAYVCDVHIVPHVLPIVDVPGMVPPERLPVSYRVVAEEPPAASGEPSAAPAGKPSNSAKDTKK